MEALELCHPTFSHNCYRCGDLFDSESLTTPCPQCGCVEGRDSICLDPHYRETYGIQRSRDWPYILALHELPAWAEVDLPDHYSDYRARNGDRLDFEAFVDEHFVRHPFRAEVRYLRRADYAAALAAIDCHEEAGQEGWPPLWRTPDADRLTPARRRPAVADGAGRIRRCRLRRNVRARVTARPCADRRPRTDRRSRPASPMRAPRILEKLKWLPRKRPRSTKTTLRQN